MLHIARITIHDQGDRHFIFPADSHATARGTAASIASDFEGEVLEVLSCREVEDFIASEGALELCTY